MSGSDIAALALHGAMAALGDQAIYTPGVGEAAPVTVFERTGDQVLDGLGVSRHFAAGVTLEVTVAALVEAGLSDPAAGDVVTVDAGSFEVRSAKADPLKLFWVLDCIPT